MRILPFPSCLSLQNLVTKSIKVSTITNSEMIHLKFSSFKLYTIITTTFCHGTRTKNEKNQEVFKREENDQRRIFLTCLCMDSTCLAKSYQILSTHIYRISLLEFQSLYLLANRRYYYCTGGITPSSKLIN